VRSTRILQFAAKLRVLDGAAYATYVLAQTHSHYTRSVIKKSQVCSRGWPCDLSHSADRRRSGLDGRAAKPDCRFSVIILPKDYGQQPKNWAVAQDPRRYLHRQHEGVSHLRRRPLADYSFAEGFRRHRSMWMQAVLLRRRQGEFGYLAD